MLKRILPFTLLISMLVASPALAHQHAHAAADEAVPLGDGKYQTTGAKKGYIFSCTKVGGGGGALQDGPWIKSDGTWVPSEKLAVEGSVSWPQASFTSKLTGSKLLLSGNGLPVGATTGNFPIASTDPAYNYDRNPATITAQTLKYSLTATPKRATKPTCLSMGAIGVMLNGVPIYNGLDGQGKDAPAHEIQDSCNGHPGPGGSYHYHSLSSCIKDEGSSHSALIGYALDGFGIYGPRSLGGKEVTNDQLDVCHGHSHKLTVKGKKKTVYHYHTTNQYPYTLGCFRGTPVKTKSQQPGGQQPQQPGGQQPGGQQPGGQQPGGQQPGGPPGGPPPGGPMQPQL